MFKGFRRLSSQYKIYRLWFSYMGVVSLTLPEDVEVSIRYINYSDGDVEAIIRFISLLFLQQQTWKKVEVMTPSFLG